MHTDVRRTRLCGCNFLSVVSIMLLFYVLHTVEDPDGPSKSKPELRVFLRGGDTTRYHSFLHTAHRRPGRDEPDDTHLP